MLVQRLEIDSVAEIPPEGVIDNPSWSMIESAIRSLHPEKRPWIWLRLTSDVIDDDYMTVMGGDGVYWLAVTRRSALGIDQRRLFNADLGSREIELWTSDQGFADCEFHTTGRVEDVLSVVRYFCECGNCDPKLSWE
jgi:hypothetical protein